MHPERAVRTVWIVVGLVLGFALVAAGPVFLFRSAFNAGHWNESTLKADFQSMRYEAGGLIFRYTVHNLTGHPARFEPALTEVHALQTKDRAAVGYPNIALPLNVPAHSSHVIEVRLELAGLMQRTGLAGDEQTRRVLQSEPPGAPLFPEAPVSPLPMRGSGSEPQPTAPSPDFSLQTALSELNGFELVDDTNGIRLLLPRGW
jgi:hypothetical protein